MYKSIRILGQSNAFDLAMTKILQNSQQVIITSLSVPLNYGNRSHSFLSKSINIKIFLSKLTIVPNL